MAQLQDLFIGGRTRPSLTGLRFDDTSPATGEVYRQVAAGGPEDAILAVSAAANAFPDWSTTTRSLFPQPGRRCGRPRSEDSRRRPRADGLYARPTVLTSLAPSARLYHQESFSPVVSIHPVTSDDEALEVANDTEYGLIGSVLAHDRARGDGVAARLRAGAVHVNGPSVGDEPHVAFGGLGASGYGRLGGTESVRAFTDQRTFYLHDRDSASIL